MEGDYDHAILKIPEFTRMIKSKVYGQVFLENQYATTTYEAVSYDEKNNIIDQKSGELGMKNCKK